jgi:hypothetical protein
MISDGRPMNLGSAVNRVLTPSARGTHRAIPPPSTYTPVVPGSALLVKDAAPHWTNDLDQEGRFRVGSA